MNIYTSLSSIPHNTHYLDRYFKFISSFTDEKRTEFKTEAHHICPRALFPTLKNFKEHPWNKVNLTCQQHFIAHWMLWKAYGGKMIFAFWAMQHQKSKGQERYTKINGKSYQQLKEDASFIISITNKNRPPVSEETKIKLKVARQKNLLTHKPNLGRIFSQEWLDNMSKASKGKPKSKEHCLNVSKALTGRIRPESDGEAMSLAKFNKRLIVLKLTEPEFREIIKNKSLKEVKQLYKISKRILLKYYSSPLNIV